jgi:hypothetical protein
MKKATAAPARKLAVIIITHRMLADGAPFTTQPAKRRGTVKEEGPVRSGLKVIL